MNKDTAQKTISFQIMRSMIDHIFGKEINLSTNDFLRVYNLYNENGGKWEVLVSGDMDSFMMLKDILESFVEVSTHKKEYGLK